MRSASSLVSSRKLEKLTTVSHAGAGASGIERAGQAVRQVGITHEYGVMSPPRMSANVCFQSRSEVVRMRPLTGSGLKTDTWRFTDTTRALSA